MVGAHMAKKTIRVIFFTPVPIQGAGCRFRIAQYLPFLTKEGFKAEIRPFFDTRFFNIVYKKGYFMRKAVYFFIALFRRLFEITQIYKYDIIYIYREMLPFGVPILERFAVMTGKPVVFDFDDAIYLSNYSDSNSWIRFFRPSKRTASVIKMSGQIIAGNTYLEEFALRYNQNTKVLPTVIDTAKYFPRDKLQPDGHIVIGWIGTPTTGKYLKELTSVFKEILEGNLNVVLKIIGSEFSELSHPRIMNKAWSLEEEIADLSTFDIGIMPMPDNGWTKGKCGFKAIQYMAMGIPAVCQAVGANKEIITSGRDGFLVSTAKEWLDALDLLINDKGLRSQIGLAARNTVVQRYSLGGKAPELVRLLKDVAENKVN